MTRARTTREQAYDALFDLVKTVTLPAGSTWGVQMRGIKSADEVPPANQPALFVSQGPERASRRRESGVQTWDWWAAIVIYFRTDPMPVVEDWQFANAVLESLENILYDRDGRQTLGGVVVDCFIEGEIGLFPEPENMQQQTLVVPVVMIVGE
jgi:hypothetical protein